MANDLQQIADIAIVSATMALRNMSLMPRLVSRDLDSVAAEKNKVIQVPIFPAMDVNDVSNAGTRTYGTSQDIAPSYISVYLDQWKEVRFTVTDKEMAEISDSRVLPPVMHRGVIALGDNVNQFILNQFKQSSYNVVDYGTTVIIDDLIDLKKELDSENVPSDGRRHCVLSHTAEADLLKLAVFHSANQSGSAQTQIAGTLGPKFGFASLHADGQMPSHVESAVTSVPLTDGAVAIQAMQSGGTSLVTIDGGSGDYKVGDILVFGARTTEPYVVVAITSGDSSGGVIEVAPRIRGTALGDGDAITYAAEGGDQTIDGFGFHETAYAFATRPLATQVHPGVITSQATDELSGLSLRVTAESVNRGVQWSLDVLYGGHVIYPEMIARMSNVA